jgi:hypothetical protein
MPNPLASPADYEAFVYALPDRYPSIGRSSLVYIPLGTRVGKAAQFSTHGRKRTRTNYKNNGCAGCNGFAHEWPKIRYILPIRVLA